jgi:microcystin-dependent protein
MAIPYIGEIRMFGGTFAPFDWAFCNGQVLQISDYPPLFNLIGTTYGGDGQTTFALPNLQGRLPLHQGSPYTIGQTAGSETITLTANQIPSHDHPFNAVGNAASTASPSGTLPAATSSDNIYLDAAPSTAMAQNSINSAGNGQAHDNMMPYLAVSFIIALNGIYPSQN